MPRKLGQSPVNGYGKPWRISLLIAAVATAAVLATLGPQAGGPGATCDELYHVGLAGKPLVGALRHQGFAFFAPENIRQNFAWPAGGPPVQAPLGHWILGLTHHLFDPAPDNPAVVSLAAARFAPALAFGLLVFLVGEWTRRRAGPVAGIVAAACVLLTPRMFAHAHFAALDMLTTTACIAALMAITWAARPDEEGTSGSRLRPLGRFALAGAVWGLAMLVRLHGVLLLPPIAAWLLWRSGLPRLPRRTRTSPDAKPPCPITGPLVWFAAGAATLLIGWPWLWLAPLGHLGRYLASGADRNVVHVFYLGRVWADHEAPWHYPMLMSLWTVPLGFLALGAVGAAVWMGRTRGNRSQGTVPIFGAQRAICPIGRLLGPRKCDCPPRIQPRKPPAPPAREQLRVRGAKKRAEVNEGPPRLAGTPGPDAAAGGDFGLMALAGVFLLAVFAWPGVPVYDGVRLFLVVFPLWAVFAGVGAKWLVEGPLLRALSYRARVGGLAVLIAAQATGLVLHHPCHTAHYNLLAGGAWGAERLGLETTYWGDSVLESMLAEAARRAPGRPVLFGPNLAPFQAPAVEMSSPSLAEAETALVGWDASRPERAAGCEYALIYRRRADLAAVEWVLRSGEVVAEYRQQGVWLTRLVRLSPRQAEPGD